MRLESIMFSNLQINDRSYIKFSVMFKVCPRVLPLLKGSTLSIHLLNQKR